MHVVLKVLASTSIKRKKPWPRIVWIGKEKQNFLLLGDRRASVLYMPSGKTKRKISKLHALIKDCVSLAYTNNGLYVVGLLTTGNIFVWCKDSDVVTHVRGLVDLQARSQSNYKWRPKLFSSDDCNRMLVVIAGTLTTEIYLYQCIRDFEHSSDISTDESIEAWWRCGTDMEVTPLRSRVSKDMKVDAQFVTDNTLGRCCFVAFVYSNETKIQLVTLVIRWFPNGTLPVHDWHKMALPYARVSIDAKPVVKRGAFVTRWSHDGRILAIAVNQEAIDNDQLVFVSPHCKVLFIVALPFEYSGLRHHRWVCDLAWTHNDLFVVTINQLGSICLISRLGEPLSIAMSGCSMDLPVSLSLNIHPFIFVKPHNTTDKDSSNTVDILKQLYSICCHPNLPMFLCSDGYMVTCLQFPQPLMDPFKFIDVCSRQSDKYLRVMRKCLRLCGATMDLTEDFPLLASTLHKSAIEVHSFEVYNGIGADSWERAPMENEAPSESDSSNLKSEQVLHHYSTIGKHESGSLVFGTQDTDGCQFKSANFKSKTFSLYQLLHDTKKETGSSLLSIWGVLVTVNETWTIEWEDWAKKASDIFVKVCAEFLPIHPSTETIEQLEPESSFGSVVSLINNLMNLCHFSALNKSIMPTIMSTVFAVFRHMIKYVKQFQLHDLHLIQLYNLLESTEEIFVNVFATIANQLLCFVPQNNLKNAFFFNGNSPSKIMRNNKLILRNRFVSIWIKLYKTVVKLMDNSNECDDNCITLLGRLQRKLQSCNVDLNRRKKRHRTFENAEKVLICDPFKYENVAEVWKNQVEASLEGTDVKSRKTSARLLHSILYTFLGGYHLKDAISLIYWLLTRDCAHQIDIGLRHPAIRQTIRSFARFMAAYFVDERLYVYPYHCPQYISSSPRHANCQMQHRIVPVCRLKLIRALEVEKMAYHWTADVMIALFLSSGYIHEVAELVHRLGDWKTAFVLLYASRIVSESKSSKLVSHGILESRLCELMKSHCSSQSSLKDSLQPITASFQNCFLAAALCDIDVATIMLDNQLHVLQGLMQHLTLIVPAEVYLPHPPPYCPQQNEQNFTNPESIETKVRGQIARHIQLFIVVLRALQCTTHFIDIYLHNLSSIVKRIARTKELLYEDWPLLDLFLKLKEKLVKLHQFHPEQRQRLDLLALHFRDFCAVCWFLHVRDKMNMHLRRFKQQLLKNGLMPAKFCLNTLQWAVHLIPFAEAVGWNLDVYHLIISVLLEAPRDRRSSLILAQCFPDMSQIPTELDYRISSILNVWRSTVIKVPSNRRQQRTAKTLSVIHLNQCDGVKNTLNQLKNILGDFNKNVFTSCQTENYLHIAARSFEIERDYFTFLGLMFDVGIIKDSLDDDATLSEIPILNLFKDSLQQQYLVRPLFAAKGIVNERKRNAMHEILIDADTLKETKSQLVPNSSVTSDWQCKKSGLLRSLSLTELNRMKIPSSPLSVRVKSLSNLDKPVVGRKQNKETTPALPKCSSLLSLCDAIIIEKTLKKSPHYDHMLQVLSWLVRWTKREDYLGNSIEENVARPRLKIQITFNQLVSAIQQAINISSKHNQLDIHEKSIAAPLPDNNNFQLIDPVKCRKRQAKSIDDGLLKRDLVVLTQQSKNTSDKRKTFSQRMNLPESSNEKQFEVSILTSDNSFSSLESDSRLTSEAIMVNDDLTSATTSRWTNSGRFPEGSSKGIPSSIMLSVSPDRGSGNHKTLAEPPDAKMLTSSTSNQPTLLSSSYIQSFEPIAASTKDFACGDGLIWGSRLIDTCIQVNDESLVGIPLQSAKENDDFIAIDSPSTCDDTQNDACSLPITTSMSVGEAHSLQNPHRVQTEKGITRQRFGHAEFEQENVHSTVPVKNVRENEKKDFTQLRLIHLPAEKELCALSRAGKNVGSIIPDNSVPQVPALLRLEPEYKFIKNIAFQTKPQSQPKMLSHQEIQNLQSKLQSDRIRKRPNMTITKSNFHKYSVPPLLQLNMPPTSILSPSFHQQIIGLGVNQVALPRESQNASALDRLTTNSQGVKTVSEREHFTTISSAVIPNKQTISSQGKRVLTQGGQFTTTTGSQTLAIMTKHISTLTDNENQQMQDASSLVDIPRSSTSIGINTSQQDDFPKNVPEKPYLAVGLNTNTVAQATQTEELNVIEGMESPHHYTDELHPFATDKGKSATDLFIDDNRTPDVYTGLEEKYMNNDNLTSIKIQPAREEAREKHTNVVDIKMMRERLERLQNEGLLSVDMHSLKVKNRQLQVEKSIPIDTHSVKMKPVEFYLQRNCVEEPDDRAELLAWMKSRRSMQQIEFKNERENLKQLEKEPFVLNDSNSLKINFARAEEQRKQRQLAMHSDHYEMRKNEAVKLMQELVQDEEAPVLRRTANLRRSQPLIRKTPNASARSTPGLKRDFQNHPAATYVLSRGLRPLKGNSKSQPRSLPASPSRQKAIPSNFVSCPASPKNSRTTYIERLQALQPPRLKEKSHLTNFVRSQDRLEEDMHLPSSVPHTPDYVTSNDSSSCETLSPWLVPDEVQHLLFGKTYRSKVHQKHNTGGLNGNLKSPTQSDTSINWEETYKTIDLH